MASKAMTPEALVHHIAEQIHRVDPASELDACIRAGTVGLERASEQFDPDRGLAFTTFAAPQIRRAILDHLHGGPKR